MKFYSEQTKKLYDTKDELTKAEAELATKKEADKKLADFCKKYGSFHTTVNEVIPSAFDTLLDWLWF